MRSHSSSRRPWLNWLAAVAAGVLIVAPTVCSAQSAELAGVHYPATQKLDGQEMVLNGSGISYRAVAKLYTVALYVPRKSNKASAILGEAGPRQLRIVMLQAMRVDELNRVINTGIEANSSRDEFFALVPAIQKMSDQFGLLPRLTKGSVITIDGSPKQGTMLALNGNPMGPAIEDPRLFNAILRVWLGDKPNSEVLKDALLSYTPPPVLNALD